MKGGIQKDLSELVTNNVITEQVAHEIKVYFDNKQQPSSNRLLIVFSILGALLTGMGIFLIIAHNWDDLTKFTKIILALLPLFIGQLACGYSIFWQKDTAWMREAAATFLFFGIAASISIVSQVYNINGSLSGFLLTWSILSFPIIYIMRSSMVSLLFICSVTWYACETSYFHYNGPAAWWYWPLIFSAIPYYYGLSKTENNFFHFHTWFISVSLAICLGTVAENNEDLMFIAYFGLLSGFVSLGQLDPYKSQKLIANAFLVVGSLGIIATLLSLSFKWFWKELEYEDLNDTLSSSDFIVALILTLVATYLLYRCTLNRPWSEVNLKSFAFIIFIALFVMGFNFPIASQVLTNVVIFIFAVFTIISGARQDRLAILNYGLLILTALVICRFLDTNMTFILRGLLFIGVGTGFFAANYYMIKKRNRVAP
ncbi:MAG TPA: DUF2157 domain-containing protein [Cyclobacteriaceae bacterium]|nr:DUF2157 domain-containing protein [Cyclobacteriaceae bacterium]